MLKILVMSLALAGGYVHAEEKNCAVKGMHCEDCVASVKDKVCEEGKYSTCSVNLSKEKKNMGEVHLITKDAKAKIDEKMLGEKLKDTGYTLEKCSAMKTKAKTT